VGERLKKAQAIAKKLTVTAELDLIASVHGGKLRDRDVVQYARNPDTALHARFNWNIKEAAYEHWLSQARELIRVRVTLLPRDESGEEMVRVRTYMSLTTERGEGKYRRTVDILRSESLRKQMLEDALDELKAFRYKYATLSELDKVHAEIEKLLKNK